MDYRSFIGNKIRYYRHSAGITQEELGERLGISKQNINRWEAGKTAPTIENLAKIAKALDIHLGSFFPDNEASNVKEEECNTHLLNAAYMAKNVYNELRGMRLRLFMNEKIGIGSVKEVRRLMNDIHRQFEASIREYNKISGWDV